MTIVYERPNPKKKPRLLKKHRYRVEYEKFNFTPGTYEWVVYGYWRTLFFARINAWDAKDMGLGATVRVIDTKEK